MPRTASDKLKDLVSTVQSLPAQSQEVLVREFEERITELTRSNLSPGQRAEIVRRLALPRQHVTDEHIRSILSRYGSGV